MNCTAALYGKSIFAKIDLQSAYNQIPVHPDDVPKIAIITPFGLFEFNMMTFGLCNAAQIINSIMMDFSFVFVYLEQHLRYLEAVFKRLVDHGQSIKLEKCLFGQTSLYFLGHRITQNGVKPLESKAQMAAVGF